MSGHVEATGCGLSREDFHPDGEQSCAGGGRPDEHPPESDGKVYVVLGPDGFTESFGETTIDTLVRLGLIKFERENHALVKSAPAGDVGVGRLHRFYVATGRVTP